MNSNFINQHKDLNAQINELMETVRLQSANIQSILQIQASADEQRGIRNDLNCFDVGGATELKIGEPHQVGPPVSFASDNTIHSTYLNVTPEISYDMFGHQIVNSYLYPSSFTSTTTPVYMYPSTHQQLSSHSTPQLIIPSTLQSYASTTNLPNEVEFQLFDKMLERQYLNIEPTNSKPVHQMFDKHSERVETTEPIPCVTLIPPSGLLQDADNSYGEHSYVLPIFDGNDPRDWILEARNYFEFKNEADADKIRLAGLHFEGRAQTWYRWFYETRNEQVDWQIFLHDLLVRFDDYEMDMCYLVNPLSIQQQSSVNEFKIEFLKTKEIAEYVYNFVFPEEILAHNFINGLKEEIRETIDLWSLKTFQGAVNWAKFQEHQIEEILLFEATEVEYEMYEGMKRMFKENSGPGKAPGGCVEDITTALQCLEVTNELVVVDVLFAKFQKLEVTSRNNMISIQCEATRRTVKEIIDPGLNIEIECLDIEGVVLHTSDNLVASDHGYSLGGWLMQLDRLDKQFNDVRKANVQNFDPGGGTFIDVQAINSWEENYDKVQGLLLLEKSNAKFSYGDFCISLLEKEKSVASLCMSMFLCSKLGQFNQVFRNELAKWNTNLSYAINEFKQEKFFEWFGYESRNDVSSVQYFAFPTLLVAYNTYFVLFKGREIRAYSPKFGLFIQLVVDCILIYLYTEPEIGNYMMSFFEHIGLLDDGFVQGSMKMEKQSSKLVETCLYLTDVFYKIPPFILEDKDCLRKGHDIEVLQHGDVNKVHDPVIHLHVKITANVAERCTRTEILLLIYLWSDGMMLLQAGKAIDRIAVDGNLSEAAKQYSMPPMSQKEHLVELVDHVFSCEVNADGKTANGSLECLQYKHQTTSSNGLRLDEFRLSDALPLLNVPIAKKGVVAWYGDAIILVFDPGDCDDRKANIKFKMIHP